MIREAMRGKGKAALGRVVLSKRERVIMLQPWDRGLVGTTLRYAYELRDSHDYFPDLKVPKDIWAGANQLLALLQRDIGHLSGRRIDLAEGAVGKRIHLHDIEVAAAARLNAGGSVRLIDPLTRIARLRRRPCTRKWLELAG